jgi:hypothetical protein
MHAFSRLVCGFQSEKSNVHAAIYTNIASLLEFYFEKSIYYYKNTGTEEKTFFAPFCARALLEISLTAILGRIDPFRLLIVSSMQGNPNFELGQKNNTAIQWSQDIMCDNHCTIEKNESKLWDQSTTLSKISRSLFSPYIDSLLWEPAFNKFIDTFDKIQNIDVVTNIKQIETKKFIPTMKGKASRLYPSLSKGVHVEFVLPIATILDNQTIDENIVDCIEILTSLAIVSHFIDQAHYCLDADTIIPNLENIQGKLNG